MINQNSARRSKNHDKLAMMLDLTIFICFYPIVFPGGVTLAFMIFPLLIVAQGYDIKMTAILAFMMALVNQIAWYTTKAGLVKAPIWQNPHECMVPRIAIGLVSYYMGLGLRKLFLHPVYCTDASGAKILTNKKELEAKDFAICAASTAVGVFTNTALCGLFAIICYNGKVLSDNTMVTIEFILAWFSINFVIEIIAFSALVPPIIMALRKAQLIPPAVTGRAYDAAGESENSSQHEAQQTDNTQNEDDLAKNLKD